MEIKVEKIISTDNPYFEEICNWQMNWWGKDNCYENLKVIEWMERCLNENSLPQTYVAIINDNVVGMYQIVIDDDIDIRPDYFPWVANIYIEPNYRGQGILKVLLNDLENRCKKMGIKRIYLHSRHVNLYEKYGWVFLEKVVTFQNKEARIFYLDI